MALSRIWAAFIIIAVLVASYKWIFNNDQNIFSRMVVGRADDPYDTVYYAMIGSPEKSGVVSAENFSKNLLSYGYKPKDSAHNATVLITDDQNADSVSFYKNSNLNIKIYTYRSIQNKLSRKADGIIETCKGAITIAIGLIGIMTLFMGFMTIAERAGGIRLLSRIIGPFFSKTFSRAAKRSSSYGSYDDEFFSQSFGS